MVVWCLGIRVGVCVTRCAEYDMRTRSKKNTFSWGRTAIIPEPLKKRIILAACTRGEGNGPSLRFHDFDDLH
ncbi:hypothetical protein P153DRAFT_108514 [Dothidotthia symphoricarpi CBS 119687]|uniref:Uncharacterized protein n=1 Tax=Dothidotthia symphoricarpi CBS 119687 TaxID=1392245 RepID=A0A6A6ARU7_9PLEO|nr:uncharacterized protein P153DRAFT_108514 [Dothidotthia symphoricarpi CBS 119687]KAF2134266.1 hypothetical protein P153DRAFT_108514 [Dothidotthia symphoricarpi CBS 119687]